MWRACGLPLGSCACAIKEQGIKKGLTDFFIPYKATVFRNAQWAADAHEFILYLLGELACRVPLWMALGESTVCAGAILCDTMQAVIMFFQNSSPDALTRCCRPIFYHRCSLCNAAFVFFIFHQRQAPNGMRSANTVTRPRLQGATSVP